MKLGLIKLRLFTVYKIWIVCVYDFFYLLKYSLSPLYSSKDKKLANIMLTTHSIEKGLSFNKKKSGWGKIKVLNLCRDVIEYYNLYGDDIRIQTAIDVLIEYQRDSYANKEKSILNKIENIVDKCKTTNSHMAGLKPIQKPSFELSEEDVWNFFSSRSSVRYFSDERVTENEVQKAIDFASLTPTACNRQTTKVHMFENKDVIKKIIENQLGDQGWCYNAKVLFVLTSNGSYFNPIYESKQVYIDGGMYAMNFCMGLHVQKIASCFKMFVRIPKLEKEFKKICNIPKEEIPIVLVLAGHYPVDAQYKSPLSHRIINKI